MGIQYQDEGFGTGLTRVIWLWAKPSCFVVPTGERINKELVNAQTRLSYCRMIYL